jgi:hypothetical protein
VALSFGFARLVATSGQVIDIDFPWHQEVLGDRMRGGPRGASCSVVLSFGFARLVATSGQVIDMDFAVRDCVVFVLCQVWLV